MSFIFMGRQHVEGKQEGGFLGSFILHIRLLQRLNGASFIHGHGTWLKCTAVSSYLAKGSNDEPDANAK